MTNFCPRSHFCGLTQHALLSLIENWKRREIMKLYYGGATLMDLSKASSTINHDLLTAKSHGYRFFKGVIETNKVLFN